MRIGYGWLLAGLAGATLLAPSVARAQVPESPLNPGTGAPGTAAPGVGNPGTDGGGGGAAAVPGQQGSFRPPPTIRPGQPVSVLVFPFGYQAGDAAAAPGTEPAAGAATPSPVPATGVAANITGLTQQQRETVDYVTAAVKAGFLSTPAYSVATYHPRSALVLRARNDEILRAEHVADVQNPDTGVVDEVVARTIAHRLGIQTFLVGTVETVEDPKTNTSELIVEARLIDSTTGAILRAAAVSGAAAGAEGVPPVAIRERAAQDAAQKVFPAMGIQLVAPAVVAPAAAPATGGRRSRPQRRTTPRRPATGDRAESDAADDEAGRDPAAPRRAAAAPARNGGEKSDAAVAEPLRPVPPADPVAAPPAAPVAPVAPPAVPVVEAPAATATTVQGIAGPNGNPVPYGYALSSSRDVVPTRDRRNLRVPSWLGVAGFLAGVAFLL